MTTSYAVGPIKYRPDPSLSSRPDPSLSSLSSLIAKNYCAARPPSILQVCWTIGPIMRKRAGRRVDYFGGVYRTCPCKEAGSATSMAGTISMSSTVFHTSV